MRQILVNYAESSRAQKRGGGALKVELNEAALVSPAQSEEILDLHEALEKLGTQVATLYAQRHEPDEMFKWLDTAYANRDGGLVRLFVIPFLTDYRDDPRFAAFCRKLGIENLPPKP